jgi:hypothetical protein
MVVDPAEMEHVPFNQAGTVTLSSREHPSTTLTVSVAPTKSFKPATATVDEGQSILVVDASGRKLTMDSTPDLGMGMGHRPEEFPTAKLTVDDKDSN